MNLTLSDIQDSALAAELKHRGYVVVKPSAQQWMTLYALAVKIDYHPAALSRAIARSHPQDPPGLITERGPSGRILRCLPSPEFYAWLGVPHS